MAKVDFGAQGVSPLGSAHNTKQLKLGIPGGPTANTGGVLFIETIDSSGDPSYGGWLHTDGTYPRWTTGASAPSNTNTGGYQFIVNGLTCTGTGLTTASGQSNYTGTGVVNGQISLGTKSSALSITGIGGHAGFQVHLSQGVGMTAATNTLIGYYATVSSGNVTSTNGELVGYDIYTRNAGTGTVINETGGRIMLYNASGSSTKYKKGLHIDILDQASTHPSGGGTQGLIIQSSVTSITNNQLDMILINQNSSVYAFSGITFKGKIGASSGNGAVINFVGSGDTAAEGNKEILFKFRTSSTTYTVTPAQFKTALGSNCSSI